jgi:dCTP deaminase
MKSDKWIKQQSIENEMIKPFVDHSVKNENGRKVTSYGLSCAGYDLRLSEKVYHKVPRGFGEHNLIDPKNISLEDDFQEYQVYTDANGARFISLLPGVSLASSVEWIKMPRDASAFVLAKSSYARIGVDVINPLVEPEWQGNMTLAIRNNNTCPVKLYLNEGFCQLVFYGIEGEVETSYEDKGGKYQGTSGVAVTRM